MGQARAMLRIPLLLGATLALSAYQLPPFKDGLFAYPAVLETARGGDDIVVDYSKARDIMGRDAEPRRKAKARFVSRGVRWSRKRGSYRSASGRRLKMFTVGRARSPRVSVIYLHGRGGNRRQGVNDYSFGGNFNRLQNLLTKGRGRLYTPDYSGFGESGTQDVLGLIRKIQRQTPNTFLVVACGSMGSIQCWRLARNPEARRALDGMVVLGGRWDEKAVEAGDFPVVFAHGSLDNTYPVARQRAFADAMRRAGRPVRFIEFRTGVHGTPIRMIDWRRELNWLLSHA